jgi:hypothetical protein
MAQRGVFWQAFAVGAGYDEPSPGSRIDRGGIEGGSAAEIPGYQMLNVIRFLAQMGSEAQWDEGDQDKWEAALAEAGVEDACRAAILNKDAGQLQILLQQKPLFGVISPGEEEEEEEEEDEPGEKDVRHTLASSLTVER